MMKKYFTIDNFLPKEQSDLHESALEGKHFPWYLQKTTVSESSAYINHDKTKFQDIFWFSHTILTSKQETQSDYFNNSCNVINQFCKMYELSSAKILRIQANLVYRHKNSLPTPPHTDQYGRNDYIVLLYYVNDTDGDTIIFDDDANQIDSITPRKNRILIMEGNVLHSGTPPVYNDTRMVFNYNLLVDSDTKMKIFKHV